MEGAIAAVEHIVLGTQHAVGPNTTPRPTRRKRVAPLAPPIPDLHTRPTPVLTPSVSEEQADEDTEVESAHESTTSKRSRSPTRRMVDLKCVPARICSRACRRVRRVVEALKTESIGMAEEIYLSFKNNILLHLRPRRPLYSSYSKTSLSPLIRLFSIRGPAPTSSSGV